VRAARFHAAGDVRIDTIAPPPQTLGPHEVLVRIRECGICGTDLHEYTHGPIYTSPEPHPVTGTSLPVILGHEFSGAVEAVGSAVTSLRAGQRVAAMPQIYCGQCRQCRAGRQQTCENLAAVGLSGPWGGLAERGVFADYQLFPIPDSMTDTEGALVEPAAVAVHAVSSAPVHAGDTVLITGGGPIGQLAAMAAAALGAAAVILSEPHAKRRRRAETLGIGEVVDPVAVDVPELIRDRTRGVGAEVCVECSGGQPALDTCFASVALGGTVVQTALGTRPVQIDAAAALTLRDVTYRGVYCYPVTSWPRVIGLISSGRIPAAKVVTGVRGLDELTSGFDSLADPDGDHVKILIRP
jgi:(R,R)-butanediol dehydrogenase / meso-butanediol dehydrogenase / diacetyl reductase